MVSINLPHLLAVIINIAILFVCMKLFLFKPVTEFMEKRSNDIQKDIDDAKSELSNAEALKKQYEDMLKDARGKSDQIITDAKTRASQEYDQIIQQARKDAEGIIQKANQSIEIERQNVMKQIRNDITSLAFAAASRILQKNIDTEENKKVVEKFLDEEGVA